MLSLDDLVSVYPDARFVWTHRHPVEVMGSVCSLIAYTRSWVSDRKDDDLGAQQLEVWAEAIRRAMDFRRRRGEGAFADVEFAQLEADPVAAVEQAYGRLGLSLGPEARDRMGSWAADHRRGSEGTHEYRIEDFDLDRDTVTRRFGGYLERFAIPEPERG
jgi:hypothetical protein